MVHGVATLVEWDLFEIDPVSLCDCRDGGRIAGQTRKVRIEARQIVLDHRGCITLGIDRDEQRARAIRIGAKRAQNLGDLEQSRRADVRAMGKTEKHQERPTPQILVGDHLPILIGELERSADGGDLLRDRRR